MFADIYLQCHKLRWDWSLDGMRCPKPSPLATNVTVGSFPLNERFDMLLTCRFSSKDTDDLRASQTRGQWSDKISKPDTISYPTSDAWCPA